MKMRTFGYFGVVVFWLVVATPFVWWAGYGSAPAPCPPTSSGVCHLLVDGKVTAARTAQLCGNGLAIKVWDNGREKRVYLKKRLDIVWQDYGDHWCCFLKGHDPKPLSLYFFSGVEDLAGRGETRTLALSQLVGLLAQLTGDHVWALDPFEYPSQSRKKILFHRAVLNEYVKREPPEKKKKPLRKTRPGWFGVLVEKGGTK